MADIIIRDLRARRAQNIGHRTVQEGEVLTRLQFRSEDDARFFASHLRWSAFDMIQVSDSASAPATTEPKSDKSSRPKRGASVSVPSEDHAPAPANA